MRISLIIFALAALCFGQDASAQPAPKEVVIVDGQIAVNNLPESQTVNGTVSVDNLPAVQDVWVQGATDPIPVVDVTPGGAAPIFQRIFGTTNGFTCNTVYTAPTGKAIKLLGVSALQRGELDTDFRFDLVIVSSNGGSHTIRLPKPDTLHRTNQAGGVPEFLEATLSQQFENLPLIRRLNVNGLRYPPQGTFPQIDQNCFADVWMHLVDAP